MIYLFKDHPDVSFTLTKGLVPQSSHVNYELTLCLFLLNNIDCNAKCYYLPFFYFQSCLTLIYYYY